MEKFNYKSIEQIEEKGVEIGVKIPFSDNLDVLKTPAKVSGLTVPNRLIVQPMEGCDGTTYGSPDELTKRRYLRFAKGGSGLLWFEAVAVVKEGRANPRQLFLDETNLDDFKAIVEKTKEAGLKENGYEPIIIMQATHSGRYSKPNGIPEPIVGRNNPYFEKETPLDISRIATDDYLKSLEEKYGKSANLAKQAGFDGVDVKACHGYLLNELLASFTREGEYGGSFENRTKLLINAIKSANVYADEKFILTSRLSAHDGYPNPYGWGCDDSEIPKVDLTEPLKLIDIMHNELGINMLDITMGNPYQNPHVNRPYDMGGYESSEHQFVGISRMLEGTKAIQQKFKDLVVISSANTYLREFSANSAAAQIEQGFCSLVGFGRQSFAYPNYANDILNNGGLDSKKCCKVCSKCTELMRAGTVSGCVLFDTEVYLPIYKEKVLKK
jgi:2,4-dienoyl-CoA reductase-like NADH-dependent reductase (Old Yellow Enzyme family)